ncbi:MAG: CotH kinase family protein [Planctomycetota bacterium]|nr:CotH kinase family protein [Planctomycetota bacterium]
MNIPSVWKRLLCSAFTIMFLALVPAEGAFAQSSPKPGSAKDRELTQTDLFSQKRVLDVQITLAEEDWDTIRRQSRGLIEALKESRKYQHPEAPYTYVTATVTIDGVRFADVGLRKKGFVGSQSTTRPSLKVKLNHTDKTGGIDGITTLTFNNDKQDPSHVSQVLGYQVFADAGAPASRCGYAEITVNGKSLGIYSHVESVRKPMIERLFGDSEGVLYEGTAVDFHEGWGGSFELKFGDDAQGRPKIEQLIKALQGGGGTSILDPAAGVRGWVPTSAKHDKTWTRLSYKDSKWRLGKGGFGYDTEATYKQHIDQSSDFQSELRNKSASLYLRMPFQIDDLGKVRAARDLVLRMKYDDGFVAYLNGHEVASANAPKTPRWDSRATASHGDEAAAIFESFSISAFKSKLRKGKNVLAIHGLNNDRASSDMLIAADLQTSDRDDEAAIADLVDLDSFYAFWAAEGLMGFWDGYASNANNFFVYLNPTTDKFHFLPWGLDVAFQKYSQLGYDPREPISVKTKGLVAHKLYQLESGRQRYAKTLKKLLKSAWSERSLAREINRIQSMLRPHLTHAQSGMMASAMNKVRDFVEERRQAVVAEIAGGMPVWTKAPTPPFVIKGWGDRKGDAGGGSIALAAKDGKVDEVARQLDKGADINAQDGQGGTVLMLAALAGRTEVVELLIDRGADMDLVNKDGSSALHSAAFLGHYDVAGALLRNRAGMNFKNKDGMTALDTAALPWSEDLRGIIDLVAGLVGIDVDMERVQADRPRVAELLRKNGAKLGGEVGSATPPGFWNAIKTGDVESLEQHLQDGVDPNAKDQVGIIALSWAAMAGHEKVVELLVKNGAKVDGKNQDGSTPLHGATFLGQAKVVEFLVENKAPVNVLDEDNDTPLDRVAAEWNPQIQGITQWVIGQLKLKVDIDEVKKARPGIARYLRKKGAKTGDQLR